jgi:ABC-type Fe3+/spermidine/putrescine transport system ATPase subunit
LAAVLELRNVVKEFPGQRAVDGISLALERGGFYSLVGPSGCGKTTTLRLIGGFESSTSGQILLDGQDVADLKPWLRNVSTVFQSYALFPHLTAFGNVEFGLRERDDPAARSKAMAALELVQLASKSDRKPAQLSGGEKQRVALARSLVLQPKLLLLDEPLAALDPRLRGAMRAELQAMQRKTGITFLLVTHDQEEALSLSQKLAVMNQGRIEQFGTPEEVYLRPSTRFVADFLGDMNWFDGIGVRPEFTQIALHPQSDCRRARVESKQFLGHMTQLHCRLENGDRIVAHARPETDTLADGQELWLRWDPAREVRLP